MSALPANVIWLPTAQAEPVKQHPRKGRYPKPIGRMLEARRKRWAREFQEARRKAEIERLDEEWWQALCRLQLCEIRMSELGAKPTRDYRRFT